MISCDPSRGRIFIEQTSIYRHTTPSGVAHYAIRFPLQFHPLSPNSINFKEIARFQKYLRLCNPFFLNLLSQ